MGNNRRNHNFQIAYFLAGSKHTPDGAYSLLCDLKEERETALASVKARVLRDRSKAVLARRMMTSDDEVMQLDGQADLAELEAAMGVMQRNIDAAKSELDFINECVAKLQPMRKYAHLPDPEAHEAAQHDEWLLELVFRAENQLLTTGTISPDHFSTMRMHPAFASDILPAIENTKALMRSSTPASAILSCENKVASLLGNVNPLRIELK